MKKISEAYLQEENYSLFLEWCVQSKDGTLFLENKLFDKISNIIDFVKEVAKGIGASVKDIIKLIKEKSVFKFFSEFKFSPQSIWELVKKGMDAFRKVINFIPNLATKLVKEFGIKLGSKLNISKELINTIKDFFEKHKIIKLLSGVALAGILIIVWINMSFVGDPTSDFDMSDILNAFLGKLNPIDFFTSDAGIKTLILLGTGVLGLSISWFSTPVNLIIGLVITLAKHFKKKLTVTKEVTPDEEIAQMI